MDQRIRLCTAADGVRIAYARSGSGPPLVKTANWLTHLEYDWNSPVWRHWLEELSTGRTLIRYDERGCGLSDWDVMEISFEAWLRDVEAVVEAEALDRFPLLGLSQGAAVAIAYAARHPERVTALVLYGGYARGRLERDPTPQARREAETVEGLLALGWGRNDSAFRQALATLLFPDATPSQMKWLADLQRVSTNAENALRIERTSYHIDVRELARSLDVPTLVLHAREDSMIPFSEGRELAALIPGAELVPLDSRNHVLLADEPAWPRFLETVRAFLGVDLDGDGDDDGTAGTAGTGGIAAGATLGGARATAGGAREEGRTREGAGSDDGRLAALTGREREVLDAMAGGLSNDEIADALCISPKTVRNHITRVFRKLGVERRAQAIVRAREQGLGRDAAGRF